MFSFFKKQPTPVNEHASFIAGATSLFSDLNSKQKKSIFIFLMNFFPEEKYLTRQTQVPATRLTEQYEMVLDASTDDLISNNDDKYLSDVTGLPISQKKMVATMILGFHKIVPLPASAMVEHFDIMERVGITLNMYNEVIRDYQVESSRNK